LNNFAQTKHAHAQEQAQVAANPAQQRDPIHFGRLGRERIGERLVEDAQLNKTVSRSFDTQRRLVGDRKIVEQTWRIAYSGQLELTKKLCKRHLCTIVGEIAL